MNDTEDADDLRAEYDFSSARRGRYAGRFYVEPGTPVGTTVVLRKAFETHRLQPGDVGRIVATLGAEGFDLEFDITGREQPVRLTVRPGDIRLPAATEILHVRKTG